MSNLDNYNNNLIILDNFYQKNAGNWLENFISEMRTLKYKISSQKSSNKVKFIKDKKMKVDININIKKNKTNLNYEISHHKNSIIFSVLYGLLILIFSTGFTFFSYLTYQSWHWYESFVMLVFAPIDITIAPIAFLIWINKLKKIIKIEIEITAYKSINIENEKDLKRKEKLLKSLKNYRAIVYFNTIFYIFFSIVIYIFLLFAVIL
jgi:hypothetical protein